MATWLKVLENGALDQFLTSEIADRAAKLNSPRVFLIDGVETAFTSAQMPLFVQGLFRFLGVVQSNPQISSKITVRLFLRTDLQQFAGENVEQQVEGRSLSLSWDTQSILNFALSRMSALKWFRDTFVDAIAEIDSRMSSLAEGEVSVEDCGAILLRIFPEKYKRNNLKTLTFLKTYFSEGEGDTASYYPRIYDAFLRSINSPHLMGQAAAQTPQIEDGHVGQTLMVQAHDYASGQYLQQVAAELKNLLKLSDSAQENPRRVEPLLQAFRGLPTPFKVSSCLENVHQTLSEQFGDIDMEVTKSALDQMKRVGIFEDRPGFTGWWRAGRLFKNALGMKYVR